MKRRGRNSDHPGFDIHLPYVVVTTLGRIATFGLIGSFVLVAMAVHSQSEVDAVQATLITSFIAFGANAGVALGTILASTSPKGAAPQPVTVENTPAAPVVTQDVAVPGTHEPHPDAPEESDL